MTTMRTYLDIVNESNMLALHAEVETTEADLKAFMKKNPDLSDSDVRDQYLPIKARYDTAIEALGRTKRDGQPSH